MRIYSLLYTNKKYVSKTKIHEFNNFYCGPHNHVNKIGQMTTSFFYAPFIYVSLS
jgi:hypothetical protein